MADKYFQAYHPFPVGFHLSDPYPYFLVEASSCSIIRSPLSKSMKRIENFIPLYQRGLCEVDTPQSFILSFNGKICNCWLGQPTVITLQSALASSYKSGFG